MGSSLLLPHGRSEQGHRIWKLLALLPGYGTNLPHPPLPPALCHTGASLPHPCGWGSVLTVPQLCEPSSPAAPAPCASSIAPLRFPGRGLTQVLLCQLFLTDHMPDSCPAPVLPNYSHHRPACRRDTCTLWDQGGSSAGLWLCHRCPLEQQALQSRIWWVRD